jgi:hypothetical protein
MAVYNQQTHYDLSVLWAMDGPRHLIGRHSNHLLGPLRISPVPAGKDAFRVAAFDAQAALGYPVVCYYGLEVGPNVEFKIDGAVHLAFVAIIRAEHFARPPALALVGMHGPIAPIDLNAQLEHCGLSEPTWMSPDRLEELAADSPRLYLPGFGDIFQAILEKERERREHPGPRALYLSALGPGPLLAIGIML